MLPDSAPPFTTAGLLVIFHRWKYLVAAALVLAAIISTVVAVRLPNVYSSTAVFLPTSLQGSDPDRLVEGSKLELGTRPEDLDRVVTIGNSLPLAELMARRFDLYHHYDMGDPGTDLAESNTLHEFSSNLSVVHNERDAIELTFQDSDKKLAAAVANAMVDAIDSVNQQLTLKNRRNVLGLYQQRSALLGRHYATVRQQLTALRLRYGIFGLEQSRSPSNSNLVENESYLNRAVIDTEKELRIAESGGPGNVAGLRRALRGLTRADGGNLINLEAWTRGNDSVSLLANRLSDLQTRYVNSKAAYEQAQTSLGSQISSLYRVQEATPATKKSKPFRALIVAGSVLLTLAFSLLLILLLELYKTRKTAW